MITAPTQTPEIPTTLNLEMMMTRRQMIDLIETLACCLCFVCIGILLAL